MSDYEHHRGRLIPIEKDRLEDEEQFFRRALEGKFNERAWKDYLEHHDVFEFFEECNVYEQFFYVDDCTIYKVIEHEEVDPYDDVQVLREDPRGGYWFEMKFYNGGTCLTEMIEESLEKIYK